MKVFALFILLLSISQYIVAKPTPMYCAVCEVVIEEINQSINRTMQERDYHIQTRFRLDEKKSAPYARSESYLLSVVEDELPSLIKQYGLFERGTDKSTDQSTEQSTEQTKAAKRAKKNQRVHLMKQAQLDAHTQSLNQQNNQSTDASADSTADSSNNQSTSQPAHRLNRSGATTAEIERLFDYLVDHHLESLLLAFHRGEGVELEIVKNDFCTVTARACKKGTDFTVNPLADQSTNQSTETAQPTLALPSVDESNKQSHDQSTVTDTTRDL